MKGVFHTYFCIITALPGDFVMSKLSLYTLYE